MSIEILILIFVVYTILNKLFGGDQKKKEELKRRQQRQPVEVEAEAEQDGATDWEQAMKELESIFSGEPVEQKPKTQPKPEPVPVQQSSSAANENPFSTEMERQRKLADFSKSRRKSSDVASSIDESNPIYGAAAITTPDAKTTKQGTDYFEVFRNPDTLVKAIVIKEVLDRPKSLRKDKAIF